MISKRGMALIVWPTLAFATVVAFQNCSNGVPVQFSEETPLQFSSTLADDRGLPPLSSPPGEEAPAVCDPFGSGNQAGQAFGIEGRLYAGKCGKVGQSCYDSSQEYLTLGTAINARILLSQIFVPVRDFTEGFQARGGGTFVDENGEILTENFGLDLRSQIALSEFDEEGLYEFATISDDGSSFLIDQGDGMELLIDNEGTHATRMKCGNRLVSLTKMSLLPMKLTYFQGPRTEIALSLIFRKVDPQNPPSGACAASSGFFSADKKELSDSLKSKGWKVLSEKNFRIVGENSCSTSNE